MKMIEKIKMELKSVDFGEYPDNMNPDDNTKYNTYEVEINYEGRIIKELYGNRWFDELQEKVGDVAKETMKIDILNHIVSDCNVPDDFELFKTKIKEFEMVNGITMTMPYEEVYERSIEQQDRYLSIFGRVGVEEIRNDLLQYRKDIPESEAIIRFDTNWTEMFRDGNTRVENEGNVGELGIRRIENER